MLLRTKTLRFESEFNLGSNSNRKLTSNQNDMLHLHQSRSSVIIIKEISTRKKVEKFLDSTPVIIIMTILTFYALFFADIQSACIRIEVDEAANVIQCILIAIFGIEFLLNCFAKDDYILGFFFWLDLISTVSLIQDIDYIINPIMKYGPTKATAKKSTVQASKAISKVSSAARATRILRVIRIIRLIRMVKLYKNVYIARAKNEEMESRKKREMIEKLEKEASDSNLNSSKNNISNKRLSKKLSGVRDSVTNEVLAIGNANEIREEISEVTSRGTNYHSSHSPGTSANGYEHKPIKEGKGNDKVFEEKKREGENEEISFGEEHELLNESKISKIITESLTKKVIVLILILLIVFPFLSEDFYSNDSGVSYHLLANFMANDFHLYGDTYYIITNQQVVTLFDQNFPPLNITINGNLYYENKNYSVNYFRFKEVKQVYSDDGFILIQYSILKETKLTGLLNIIQTIFVCICLTFSAVLFESDATMLVLQPLEVMIEIVDKVAKDPINAKNIENLKGIKAEIDGTVDKIDKAADNYEVAQVKTALLKISALLAIGFGEAGGEIIKKNLEEGKELNPKLRGKRKFAIFGFCDIRQFEEINLSLEEKVIQFVNEVAEIVHSSVDRFGGAVNKNIGEAFLNVWKFYNEVPIRDKSGRKLRMQRKDNLFDIDPKNIQVSITADMSVIAFLRVIKKINKCWNVLRFNKDIEKCIPNFKLNMGFGLHMGYGIEGAVGSTYKIDASYLSPNVNIAARLESATRQFGVFLLLSGTLYKLLSEEMKRICRLVDCVMVKGSVQPLELYTVDVNVELKPKEPKYFTRQEKKQRYADKKELVLREAEKERSIKNILLRNSYAELLSTKKTEEFDDIWVEGIESYKKGYFKEAGEKFKECLKIDPSDGPAKTLLRYFETVKYTAPKKWKGVRELTSK